MEGGGPPGRTAAPQPIPGARPLAVGEGAAWAVLVSGGASQADTASVTASMAEGLFSSSLRRHSEGYGSSLGGHGHGAWLSSSPHPTALRGGMQARPPLYRSPSLNHQGSGVALLAHDEYAEDEEERVAAAAAAAQACAVEAGTPPFSLGPDRRSSLDMRASMDRRSSLDRVDLSARPQRWHLGALHPAEGSELAEPQLSGDSDNGALSPLPGTPQAKASTLEAAEAVVGGSASAPVGVVRSSAADADGPQTDLTRALVFGVINSVATIPALVAYAAIVFKDPIYAPYLDLLCKFFFLSSAVHQTVFCLLSTLPFSVGQVQDVGLIFLSAMATSIAGLCLDAGRDAATALGTSLLTMSIATFFTGAMTLLVAHYKLAQLVQYLPLPVIGGYLSFVGYFCVASGIGLGVTQDIDTLSSWASLFCADSLIKLVPTLAACLAMIFTLKHFSHPLALPTVLLTINVLFHLVRLALGISLEQAMDAHWVIRPAEGTQKFWELWDLFNIHDWSFSGIYWPGITEQVVKTLGLALVVIFGSAMDIAAIQQDLRTVKVDFNREMVTVAVSNMATGAAGCGYTGSYIFSQTIFTMRAGVFSRWNGVVVALSEYIMFALPFPVIQYMPNFFFGALLLWFGIEISRDWLVLSYSKMTRTEYGLLLATFGAIMQWGLEGGIAAGFVLSSLYFAYAYAQSQVASIGTSAARSSVVRTVEQQAALQMLGVRLACTSLSGFVFFGSANTIGQKLQEEAEKLGAREVHTAAAAQEAEDAIEASMRSMGETYVGVKHTQAVAALAAAPAYLVLDFSHVRGLDATGARTMGVVHNDLAQHGVILVVTAADHHGIRPLLLAHGVPLPPAPMHWPPEMAQPQTTDVVASTRGSQAGSPRRGGSLAAEQPWESGQYPDEVFSEEGGQLPSCLEFRTLEEGLRYCEDQLLEVAVRYGLCPAPSALMPLADMLASHLQKLPLGGLDPAGVASALRRYMSVVSLSAGQLLWKVDDPAQELFIIEKGSVRVDEFVHVDADEASKQGKGSGGSGGGDAPSALAPAERTARAARAISSGSAASLPDRSGSGQRVLTRSYECGPGCVVGSTDFYLARPHGTRAVCRSSVARVLRVTRSAMERMAAEVPQALNVLQLAVMRANTLDLSEAAAQGSGGPSLPQ